MLLGCLNLSVVTRLKKIPLLIVFCLATPLAGALSNPSPGDNTKENDANTGQEFFNSLPKKLRFLAGYSVIDSIQKHAKGIEQNSNQSRAKREGKNKQTLQNLLNAFYKQNNIHKDPGWLEISGWKKNLIPYFNGRTWRSQNQDPRGFSSSRGLLSPKDDFTEFGKAFFMTENSTVENSIKCRLPEKYQYFKKHFPEYKAYLDHTNIRCQPVSDGFLNDLAFIDPITGNALDIGPVDASTVSGFELLYATPGVGDPAEIAGHIVLRIRLDNNPESKNLSIENPNDVVVSFLANTSDATIIDASSTKNVPQRLECDKSWLGLDFKQEDNFDAYDSISQALKGLSGGFLTTMDRQTLAQTVHHYTVYQDRNLVRYRLNITEQQKISLLNRLYAAKKNYNGRYFFFKENCGSVLYRVVGEGIGNEKIADFDPIVTPPNALLTQLVREGVASRVYPSFLSYRQKGYVSQELLKRRYENMSKKYPHIPWPQQKKLFSEKDKKRSNFFKALGDIAEQHPHLHNSIYHFASIGQEAEQAYAYNEIECRNITSQATSSIRHLQKKIINKGDQYQYSLRTQNLIDNYQSEQEYINNQTGFDHTALLNVSVSLGRLTHVVQENPGQKKTEQKELSTLHLNGALHSQNMGDRAKMGMQRATSIVFGQADLVFSQASSTLEQWQFTGLHIRKFKERLNTVPPITSPDFRLGIGLTALDISRNKHQQSLQAQLVGAELLANVAASRLYSRHLFISLGVSLDSRWQNQQLTRPSIDDSHVRVAIPLELNGLWSFDEQRRWQMRFKVGKYSGFGDGKYDQQYAASVSLNGRVGEVFERELIFTASSEYLEMANDGFDKYAYRVHQLGLTVNPW